jgi:hypothetical protein
MSCAFQRAERWVPDFLTIVQAGRLIERKELSPIELIESRIDRITRLDGSLNSFICVLAGGYLGLGGAGLGECLPRVVGQFEFG